MHPADESQLTKPNGHSPHPLALLAATLWLVATLSMGGCSQTDEGEGVEAPGSGLSSEVAALLEPERGYQPRACGFDLDDDGILGEEEDCRICDGRTTDPDGDGVDEDLLYVACGEGVDQPGCGAPDLPCGSLAWALDQADGFADGAEDIVCFRGLCPAEDLRPGASGGEATRIEPPVGAALRPWERHDDPAMLVGWDSDGDGEYPPFDTDDVADLEGAGKGRAIRLGGAIDALELAHFRAADYGRFSADDGELPEDGVFPEDSGFLSIDSDGATVSHLSVHDLELRGINMERAAGRRVSAFHLSTETSRIHWFDFDNLLVTDNGGAFALAPAAGEGPDNGPLRWRNITHTAHGCDALDCDREASALIFAFSGHVSGVEVVDSVWDANIDHWLPKAQGGISGATFAVAARYSQDVLLRNNRIYDHKNALVVRGGASREYGDLAPRPVDGIVFDRNHVSNRFERWKYGDFAVEIRDGEEPGEVVGSVSITNNVFVTSTPWDGCIALRPGSDHDPIPGRLLVAFNTCSGPIDRYAALVVGDPEGGGRRNQQQNILLLGNLLTNLGPRGSNIQTSYSPDGWQAEGNVYQEGSFKWSGRFLSSLDQWRSSSGGDAESRTCEAPLGPPIGLPSGQLATGDLCARDAGVDPAPYLVAETSEEPAAEGGVARGPILDLLRFDFEGEPRPQGEGWDAGADEVATSSVSAAAGEGPSGSDVSGPEPPGADPVDSGSPSGPEG